MRRKLYRHTMEQQMALLPNDRVEESPPFTFSVVDILGPYSVKKIVDRYIRGMPFYSHV